MFYQMIAHYIKLNILISQAPQALVRYTGSAVTPITGGIYRSELDAPVLATYTEFELGFGPVTFPSFGARQADDPKLRVWEVAGAAHFEQYVFDAGNADRSKSGVLNPTPVCAYERNQGQYHYVLNAAINPLNNWVTTGKPAISANQVSADGGYVFGVSDRLFNLDSNGNTLGGVRMPFVDVPIAEYRGAGNTPFAACGTIGSTFPFTTAQINTLYPTHCDYVKKVRKDIKELVKEGFIIKEDGKEIVDSAKASDIGGSDTCVNDNVGDDGI